MTAPTARTYGWLVLGTLAFILYGSLVPFEFHARSDSNPVGEAFTWAMTNRLRVQSRSDALANMLLGIPLGFGLLAWTCVDRGSRQREAVLAVLFLPLCVLFSMFVEFLQLYCPLRTCAGSDVAMQAIGAVLGMAAWMLAGQWLTGHARRLWGGPHIGGSAGRMLVAYLVLLAGLQALPMDLTLSPKDVYKNLRDKVHYIPFSEFAGNQTQEQFWGHVRSRIEAVGLYLPVGLLAACLPGRFWQAGVNATPIFGLALALGMVMEGIQVFVMSRTPNSSDVLLGAISVEFGWWLGRRVQGRGVYTGLEIAWAILLMVAYWQPFEFSWSLSKVEWLVLMPLEARNPLLALGDLLTKLVLFSLLGVVAVRGIRGPSAKRLVIAAAVGLTVSLIIELGQLVQPAHTPSLTDVLIGGFGAWLGGSATLRVRRDS